MIVRVISPVLAVKPYLRGIPEGTKRPADFVKRDA